MSTHITGLRRLGLVLALAPLAIAAFAAPAQADDRGRHNDRGRHYDRGHDRRWVGRPGGYYAPPPVVYAAPPEPVYYEQQPEVVYAPAPVVYGPPAVVYRPYHCWWENGYRVCR